VHPSTPRGYPVLTAAMLKPEDVPIPTVVAKRLFKDFMLEVGYVSEHDAPECVRYFVSAMRLEEMSLRDEVSSTQAEVEFQQPHIAARLAELRSSLSDRPEPLEASYIREEIAQLRTELSTFKEAVAKAKAALQAFKRDKRSFFVAYVNEQLHGPANR